MAFTIDDVNEDILDVRDIIARVEELEAAKEENRLSDEEVEEGELDQLSAFLASIKGYGGDEDWRGDWYPVTLILDSYFKDYARETVEECGYISEDFPSWIEVDWEATARNVRQDYTSQELCGYTYWMR